MRRSSLSNRVNAHLCWQECPQALSDILWIRTALSVCHHSQVCLNPDIPNDTSHQFYLPSRLADNVLAHGLVCSFWAQVLGAQKMKSLNLRFSWLGWLWLRWLGSSSCNRKVAGSIPSGRRLPLGQPQNLISDNVVLLASSSGGLWLASLSPWSSAGKG